MKYGGFIEDSKWEMYTKTPKNLMPKTFLVPQGTNCSALENLIKREKLAFPLVLKPDTGMRGLGIVKLTSFEDLKELSSNHDLSYILQEYIVAPIEIGVFAICKDGKWEISSLMEREFLEITGNGIDSLETLLRAEDRAFLQFERLVRENEFDWNEVIDKGRVRRLESLGNHRLGTKFKNAEYRINSKLTKSISALCTSLPGFAYGRLDIKMESWEALESLENFWIIEVNGANSEPAHIYDPSYSIFRAWSSLFYHFKVLAQLAEIKLNEGAAPLPFRDFRRLYKKFKTLK